MSDGNMGNGEGPRIEYVPMGINMGAAFMAFAGKAETLKDAILEAVQNSLDKKANIINIVLNQKTSYVAIRDNGDGVSVEEFHQKLSRIGLSLKLNDKDSLGQFGMGFLGPLGKCGHYTFTSCPKGGSQYLQWTFVTKDIENCHDKPPIPQVAVPDLVYRPQNAGKLKVGTPTWWRSQLLVHDYKQDRLLARIGSAQSLVDEIKRLYREKMLRNEAVITVKFTNKDGTEDKVEGAMAERHSGKPLAKHVVSSFRHMVGHVVFELYLAHKRKDGYGGAVEVGVLNSISCFGLETFAKSVPGEIPKEVIDALSSGIFEGYIRGEKLELDPKRKAFLSNSALEGFCKAIVEWFETIGKKHVTEVTEGDREERWQSIMLRSLANFQALLQDNPALANLRGAFDNLHRGRGQRSRGTEQANEGDPSLGLGGPGNTAASKSTSKGGGGRGGGDGGGDGGNSGSAGAKDATVDQTSLGASGPEGTPRKTAKRGGFGLELSTIPTEELLRSNRLFLLDVETATLHFNTRHPTWEACDTSQTRLQQMQETAIIFALTANGMPENQQSITMRAFEDAITPLVAGVFHNSDAFVMQRRRGKEA
ncbi:MAG: ATP-binding protein [Candidatus Pacebacteria bacterium]|nr:ATP-binding protein [Candidatus Paceibacterota bacterium]